MKSRHVCVEISVTFGLRRPGVRPPSGDRPDRHFVAARLAEMKPPAARKSKDRCGDRAACRTNRCLSRLQVVGFQDHQRRTGRATARPVNSAIQPRIGKALISPGQSRQSPSRRPTPETPVSPQCRRWPIPHSRSSPLDLRFMFPFRSSARHAPRQEKRRAGWRALLSIRGSSQCRTASSGRGLPDRLIRSPTISPSAPALTGTVSPSITSPASSISASGSCRLRWITRFSGRAPKTGS